MNFDKYDIDGYIRKCSNMDYMDVLEYTRKEVEGLRKINLNSKHLRNEKETIFVYMDFVSEFLFFLQQGIKPCGMREYHFNRTKPIIQNFVARGQWKPESLKQYE